MSPKDEKSEQRATSMDARVEFRPIAARYRKITCWSWISFLIFLAAFPISAALFASDSAWVQWGSPILTLCAGIAFFVGFSAKLACPLCGQDAGGSPDQFCPECGSVPAEKKSVFSAPRCLACEKRLRKSRVGLRYYSVRFCTHCGAHLH